MTDHLAVFTPEALAALKLNGYKSIQEQALFIPWFNQIENGNQAIYLLQPSFEENLKTSIIAHTSWYSNNGKVYPIESFELEQLAKEAVEGVSYQVIKVDF
ncbi:hypothetical protein NF867_15680 [Solitalea sp. MAHUQ-68]|uniref:Uncharacterized protein n=1 Tax=Solitalea agri TaxID=2953739 RepID=A0A9X2F3X1_9SPHI|nr:hypothetical protein [Solitalea agri]MCO4294302.1 hypothetical protein [Solitalea agri]